MNSGPITVAPVTMTSLAKKFVREWFEGLGNGAILCGEIFSSLFTLKPSGRDLLYQMYFIGVKSQSVVAITGAFTGHGALLPDLRRISQGQDGYRHACRRERRAGQPIGTCAHRF